MLDPKNLLETFGVIGLFAIVFAETGLLIGFFLPGDSLLVTAGLVCSNPECGFNVRIDNGELSYGRPVGASHAARAAMLGRDSPCAHVSPSRHRARRA